MRLIIFISLNLFYVFPFICTSGLHLLAFTILFRFLFIICLLSKFYDTSLFLEASPKSSPSPAESHYSCLKESIERAAPLNRG